MPPLCVRWSIPDTARRAVPSPSPIHRFLSQIQPQGNSRTQILQITPVVGSQAQIDSKHWEKSRTQFVAQGHAQYAGTSGCFVLSHYFVSAGIVVKLPVGALRMPRALICPFDGVSNSTAPRFFSVKL